MEQAGPRAAEASAAPSDGQILTGAAADHDVDGPECLDLVVGDIGDAAEIRHIREAVT